MPLRQRSKQTRYFEVGWSADVPRLVDPDQGIAGLRRVEHYPVTATVWDSLDHRLVRCGVICAHRIIDGRSQWYLTAPDWQPALPEDRSIDGDEHEVPTEFRELVGIVTRGAALVPTAQLHAERDTWEARAERDRAGAGPVVATVRDERVTVSRNGLAIARYREVTLTSVTGNLRQLNWLADQVLSVGAAPVTQPPSVADRLGAPANGPSDFPAAHEWDDDTAIDDFVPMLWAARLRELAEADLAVRSGLDTDQRRLASVLRRIRRELRGLAPVLESEWLANTDSLLAAITIEHGDLNDPAYFDVVDRLVAAMRFPHMLEVATSHTTAAQLTRALVDNALDDARSAVDDLSPGAPQKSWDKAVARVESLVDACAVADLLATTRHRRFTKRAVRLAGRLAATTNTELRELKLGIADMTAQEAFAAGRRFEVLRRDQSAARADVLAEWPRWRRKLATS